MYNRITDSIHLRHPGQTKSHSRAVMSLNSWKMRMSRVGARDARTVGWGSTLPTVCVITLPHPHNRWMQSKVMLSKSL